jgi:spore coat protein CotF
MTHFVFQQNKTINKFKHSQIFENFNVQIPHNQITMKQFVITNRRHTNLILDYDTTYPGL